MDGAEEDSVESDEEDDLELEEERDLPEPLVLPVLPPELPEDQLPLPPVDVDVDVDGR